MALRIKSLLYDDGFTIPGARQAIKTEMKQSAPQLALGLPDSGGVDAQSLRRLQKELRELLTMLSKPAAARGAVHPFRPMKTQRPASAGVNARTSSRISAAKDLFDASLKPRED